MKSKQMCEGCRDDHYNQPGNSSSGECWMYAGAKIVQKRRVAMDERPPWTRKPEEVLNCRRESGFVFVKPDQVR